MAIGISAIEGYYVAYLMEFFAFDEIWARRRRSLERRLRPVALMFTVGFLFILAERILTGLH